MSPFIVEHHLDDVLAVLLMAGFIFSFVYKIEIDTFGRFIEKIMMIAYIEF